MQFYKVIVRIRKLDNCDAYEQKEYGTVYANTAEEAAGSIVTQKKVKLEDIVAVQYEEMY
jgi:hypothetical protein